MLLRILLVVTLWASVFAKTTHNQRQTGVTFKNVEVRGYSIYTFKFNISIASSNSLKEHLPKVVFDQLEITNEEIPILYKNSVADIDNLDELLLESDRILEIQPGAFKNVPQLRKLTIKKNEIEEIQEGVFNNLNIATLDLSNNGISSVAPGAFDNMPELLNINLADNKLTFWDKNWFANTPLLTRASFQNNLISEIPSAAFTNFQGEKQFGSVPLTINIILSHNRINKIHTDAFKGLKKINNLWLDHNELDNFSDELLSEISSLKELRIDENKLKCLSGDLKKIIVADTTHIDANPWDCECLNFVKAWSQKNGKDLQGFYASLTCDAERIRKKVDSLNDLLKQLKRNRTTVEEEGKQEAANPNRDVEEIEIL